MSVIKKNTLQPSQQNLHTYTHTHRHRDWEHEYSSMSEQAFRHVISTLRNNKTYSSFLIQYVSKKLTWKTEYLAKLFFQQPKPA